MRATCYECEQPGHFAADCPNKASLGNDGKPPWCGICDERTRLIDRGERMARCPDCHPSRRRQPSQFRRCPDCHIVVYGWDNLPCGQHHTPHPALAG